MITYHPNDQESITLTYPKEREDEIILCALKHFGYVWDAHTEMRWRAVLADDEKRRNVK